MHEHADRGDHDQQGGREGVDVEAEVDRERAGRDPRPELDVQACLAERLRMGQGAGRTTAIAITQTATTTPQRDDLRGRRPKRAHAAGARTAP